MGIWIPELSSISSENCESKFQSKSDKRLIKLQKYQENGESVYLEQAHQKNGSNFFPGRDKGILNADLNRGISVLKKYGETTLCSLKWFLLWVLRFYPLVPLLGGGTTHCKVLEAKIKQKWTRARSMLKKIVQNSNGKISTIQIQWGSEIQTCPDLEWSIFVRFSNGLDFEWFI